MCSSKFLLSLYLVRIENYYITQNYVQFLSPATKLGQGNIFRSVCQEFCPRGGGGSPGPRAGEVEGSGQGGSPGPHPGGGLRGLAGGVSRPTPGGGEVEGSDQGGLQANTWGRGVLQAQTRGGGVSQHAIRLTPPPQ